jgi:hypothetical protein
MKAVWSYWSKPFRHQRSFWSSERHHLLSWVLSFQTARKHFPRTALYTDDMGKEMLVDKVGLEFTEVSTCLNELEHQNPQFWCLGKVLAYSRQEEPFVHIDSDVFMWSPIPERLTGADVLAQNPEAFPVDTRAYDPEQVEFAVRQSGGWLPDELSAYMPRDGIHRAFCCGILGGRRIDFLQHYARQALRLVVDPANQPAWPMMRDPNNVNMLFEQYLLAACLEYHQARADSPYTDVRIECLFQDFGDAFQNGEQAGFTHLIGGAKQDSTIMARLDNRVKADYPIYYERCLAYLGA